MLLINKAIARETHWNEDAKSNHYGTLLEKPESFDAFNTYSDGRMSCKIRALLWVFTCETQLSSKLSLLLSATTETQYSLFDFLIEIVGHAI